MNKSAGFIDLDFMFTDSYFLKAIIYVTGSVYASSLFSCYKHPRIVFVHFITADEPEQAIWGKGRRKNGIKPQSRTQDSDF